MTPDNVTMQQQLADTVQLTLSGTSAETAVAPSGTTGARIVAVSDAWIRVGPGATAAANTSLRMFAGQVETFRARPGWRVSAFQAGTGGTVDVTWMG
jgi:hypothetical protein